MNIDDVYEPFAEKVHELIPIDRITVSIINFKDKRVTLPYMAGLHVAGPLKGDSMPLAGSFTEEIRHTRMSMLIQGEDLKQAIDRFPRFLTAFQAGIRSRIAIPLISKDEVIGVLYLDSNQAKCLL